MTMFAAFLGFNALASLGLFAMSRYSVALVDDQGRALERRSDWHERVVPGAVAPEALEVPV